MRVAAAAEKLDSRLQRKVARDALPYKMEGIVGEPHILAASGQEVRMLLLVEDN